MIKHANIIYMPNISALGGIETYVYEMVKKYHKLDIAVVCKLCDKKQRERIEKYCKVYNFTNEPIECKVAIINYDQTIIPFINKEAKIYQTIHADYTMPIYEFKPKDNERITGFICITKYLLDKMTAYLPKEKLLLSYNPLTIPEEDNPIILVSATRLHKQKGKDRMQRLASELDAAKINYIWYVITNDIGGIQSDNVIFIKNRLDVSKWLAQASYVVLLSDSEACSYTISEALYRNIPVIVTPLPYLKEIGVEDNKNAYILNFDCSNIKEIVNKIKNIPKFEFKQMKDKYNTFFSKDKSNYISDYEKKVFVKVKDVVGYYYDMEMHRNVSAQEGKYQVTKYRANQLIEAGVCEILEE